MVVDTRKDVHWRVKVVPKVDVVRKEEFGGNLWVGHSKEQITIV